MARIDPSTVLVFLFCSACGAGASWLPWRVALDHGLTRAGNFVDGMQPISMLLLFLVGLVAGGIKPGHARLWGLATMSALPFVTFAEIRRDPTSHNLWPLEFVIYGFLAIFGAAGAFAGGKARSWLGRGA